VLPVKLWKVLVYLKSPTFFLERNVISKSQHKSVGLFQCIDWTVMLQDYQSVTIAYVDIASAVDTVSHKKLICRLEQYGITGCLLGWIEIICLDALK